MIAAAVAVVVAGGMFGWGRWQRRRLLRAFYEGRTQPGASVFVRPR